MINKNLYNLTPAEYKVMCLIGKGYSIPYTAEKLFISEITVKTHLGSIYSKYGISRDKQYSARTRAVYIFNKVTEREKNEIQLHTKQIKL